MFDERIAAAGRRGESFLLLRFVLTISALIGMFIGVVFQVRAADEASGANPQQAADTGGLTYYANAHPYLEESLKHLMKHIPELRALRPAAGADEMLPVILMHTGMRVGNFLENIVDLTAHEEVGQKILTHEGNLLAQQQAQYNYLILRNGQENPPRYEEYRTDGDGNRSDQDGVELGYAITTGFALKCIYFSPGMQPGSTFRYLGDQMLGERDTYVVAFAQRPTQTRFWGTVTGEWGTVKILDQGIAWIDKRTFQILRIRTDLLAAHEEIGLARQTTEVTFSEVQMPDVEKALWLPSDAEVYAEFQGHTFRNEHHYSAYERFRVSVKMGAPKTYLSCASRPRE
jgi:hypothetical protein